MSLSDEGGHTKSETQLGRITAFIAILIFLSGTDIYAIITGSGANTGELRFLTLIPIFAIIFLNFGYLVRGAIAAPELIALLLLATISVYWSIDRTITIKHLIPFLATTSLAIVVASMLSLRSLFIIFGYIAALTMIGSLIAVALFSAARGDPPWDDVWNGVFAHKNNLGAASVLAMLVAIPAAISTAGFKKVLFLFTAVIGLYLMVITQSRSAQLVGFISLILLVTGFAVKRNVMLWTLLNITLILILLSVTYVVISTGMIDPIFDILERKPTLSGRIPLWEIVWPHVKNEFWLGYGYSAFWDQDSTRVLGISNNPALRFTPYYSHNGLLETFLNTGFVGVLLFLIFVVRATWSVVVIQRFGKERKLLIASFVLIVMFLMLNVPESNILARGEYRWVIFVALCVKLLLVSKSVRKNRKHIMPKQQPLFTPNN